MPWKHPVMIGPKKGEAYIGIPISGRTEVIDDIIKDHYGINVYEMISATAFLELSKQKFQPGHSEMYAAFGDGYVDTTFRCLSYFEDTVFVGICVRMRKGLTHDRDIVYEELLDSSYVGIRLSIRTTGKLARRADEWPVVHRGKTFLQIANKWQLHVDPWFAEFHPKGMGTTELTFYLPSLRTYSDPWGFHEPCSGLTGFGNLTGMSMVTKQFLLTKRREGFGHFLW